MNIVDLYYNAKSSVRDSVKTMRANIQFASLDKEIKTVVFTSVIPNEGKTTLACFLGISVAETGKKTVVVECDYRHPMITKNFELESEVEKNDGDDNHVNARLQQTRVENLWVLDMKTKVSNPIELISSESYVKMVKKLREDFDFVIFDTPPLGAFIDAAHIAAQADGTILVVKQGQVEKRAAKDVIQQLKKANATVIGAVINNVDIKKSGYYYNRYRYGYGYGYYRYYSNYYYSHRDDDGNIHRGHRGSHKHKHRKKNGLFKGFKRSEIR